MRTSVLLLAAILATLGCTDSNENRLKEVVKRNLLDPDSAQFRDVRMNANRDCLEGQVNAKNRMGGYTGFKPFIAHKTEAAIGGDVKDDLLLVLLKTQC